MSKQSKKPKQPKQPTPTQQTSSTPNPVTPKSMEITGEEKIKKIGVIVNILNKAKSEDRPRWISELENIAKGLPCADNLNNKYIIKWWRKNKDEIKKIDIGLFDKFQEKIKQMREGIITDFLNTERNVLLNEVFFNKNPNQLNKTGNTPLNIAVVYDGIELVEELLERGADCNIPNQSGETPLMLAAQEGRLDIVNLLLDNKAKVDQADYNGFTTLHFASEFNHLEVVRSLLNKGATVDKPDKLGATPLMIAAREGNLDVVNLLLDNNAKIDQVDRNGFTTLHYASKNDHLEVVRSLLNKGATVDKKSSELTPLVLAIINNNKNLVKVLLSKTNKVGIEEILFALTQEKLEIAKVILEKIPDLEKIDGGTSLLHFAVEKRLAEIIKILFKKKADPNIEDGVSTPLVFAVKAGFTEIVEILLEAGAKVDLPDKDGLTPLAVASSLGHLPVVNLLLKNGANINQSSTEGETPLSIASKQGFTNVVDALLKAGADVDKIDKDSGLSPFLIAVNNDNIELVKLFLKYRANVNQVGKSGKTALFTAINQGNKELVRILLESGADVNKPDPRNFKPILVAIIKQDKESVKLLVEKGADIFAPSYLGIKPIYFMSNLGFAVFSDAIEVLLGNEDLLDKSSIDNYHLRILDFVYSTEFYDSLNQKDGNKKTKKKKKTKSDDNQHNTKNRQRAADNFLKKVISEDIESIEDILEQISPQSLVNMANFVLSVDDEILKKCLPYLLKKAIDFDKQSLVEEILSSQYVQSKFYEENYENILPKNYSDLIDDKCNRIISEIKLPENLQENPQLHQAADQQLVLEEQVSQETQATLQDPNQEDFERIQNLINTILEYLEIDINDPELQGVEVIERMEDLVEFFNRELERANQLLTESINLTLVENEQPNNRTTEIHQAKQTIKKFKLQIAGCLKKQNQQMGNLDKGDEKKMRRFISQCDRICDNILPKMEELSAVQEKLKTAEKALPSKSPVPSETQQVLVNSDLTALIEQALQSATSSSTLKGAKLHGSSLEKTYARKLKNPLVANKILIRSQFKTNISDLKEIIKDFPNNISQEVIDKTLDIFAKKIQHKSEVRGKGSHFSKQIETIFPSSPNPSQKELEKIKNFWQGLSDKMQEKQSIQK